MIYQKLLSGTEPYFAHISKSYLFENHCHPEIELSYCFKGSYKIVIDNTEYALKQGDLAIIGAMVPHELPENHNGVRLTIEIGPAFLSEQFNPLLSVNPFEIILNADGGSPLNSSLRSLLDETANVLISKPDFYNLTVKGNIYKISAIILSLLKESTFSDNPSLLTFSHIDKISHAINMIYNHYDEQLNLDTVSKVCGYSKSNFCKTFKAITGSSFHAMLNRHRIDIACLKLKEGNSGVEDIATSVGFLDSKNFCRVFKKVMGKSTGEYLKNLKEK